MKIENLNRESTKKKVKLKILFLSIFLFNLSWGLETISLKEVLNEVANKNPEILAAKKVWEAKKAEVPAAWALEAPMIGIMWEEIPDNFDLSRAFHETYTIQQNIPFPGKLLLQRKRALNEKNAFQEEYQEKRREILTQVKRTYYQYYFGLKAMEVIHHHVEILKNFSKITQTQYMVGKASQPDVLKIQVELGLMSNELLETDQRLTIAVSRLNILMNRAVNSPLHYPEEITKDSLKYDLTRLQNLAQEKRPQINAFKFQLEKSQAQVNLAKWNYTPDFMVKLGRVVPRFGFRGWDFEVQASLPLWFLQKENSELRLAQREKEESQALLHNSQNMVALEVQEAYIILKTKERIFELYKNSILPQALQALEAATQSYQTEKVDFLTLLDSERSLKDIELGYYQALVDYQEAFANLELAVGVDLRE